MHYAHLNLKSYVVTVDKTPWVKDSLLLAKHRDRKFLTDKIEQITNHENCMAVTSLGDVFDKLSSIDLMPPPKDIWCTLVAHRSATINACLCYCPSCTNTLKETLT